MSQSQVKTNAEKYNFTAEKAHFAKSSRQGLENLSDLPRLEFHADHDAVRIINNGQMLYKLSPIAEGSSPITNRRYSWVGGFNPKNPKNPKIVGNPILGFFGFFGFYNWTF